MTKKVLTRQMLIGMIREVYEQRLKTLMEFDTSAYSGSEKSNHVLSVGLKVRHKKTNLLYTISNLGIDDVMLQIPDGEEFPVSRKALEKEYRLD